ncbi:transcriptional regulator with XRE-family HTH domain [Microbacterium keratanolyticum]|uniref:DNA-binding protein n=1 Tax=Microbacterium keratanolyticum TaxID=67574 RepID=A0A9W6HVZ4_9MICO|nr:cupin domain-containing protein [Microbacterium keratanolyticum]MBM7468070.1 transcriptional regulator with XRE-family HTH domain [Microbacterium keratanolyticum]GLK03061.1 DNA-binding protein [Microbacterium keratanolyticum]
MDTTAASKIVGEEGPDRDFWITHLGAQLREQRTGRFTVEELAERAGVSAGLISQIERGIGNPSFATLLRLANSLDLPLASMFANPEPDNDHMVVRRADRRRIEIPSQGIIMELIVPDSERKLGVVNMTIPAHFDGALVPHSHEGEECVLVSSGRLVATVSGRDFELEAGDSLTYDASLPHWWSNRTDSAAVMLAISTPPSLGRAH